MLLNKFPFQSVLADAKLRRFLTHVSLTKTLLVFQDTEAVNKDRRSFMNKLHNRYTYQILDTFSRSCGNNNNNVLKNTNYNADQNCFLMKVEGNTCIKTKDQYHQYIY